MIKLHRKVIKQVKTFINIEKIAAKNHSDAINLFFDYAMFDNHFYQS